MIFNYQCGRQGTMTLTGLDELDGLISRRRSIVPVTNPSFNGRRSPTQPIGHIRAEAALVMFVNNDDRHAHQGKSFLFYFIPYTATERFLTSRRVIRSKNYKH